jgi:hypothetical protein
LHDDEAAAGALGGGHTAGLHGRNGGTLSGAKVEYARWLPSIQDHVTLEAEERIADLGVVVPRHTLFVSERKHLDA